MKWRVISRGSRPQGKETLTNKGFSVTLKQPERKDDARLNGIEPNQGGPRKHQQPGPLLPRRVRLVQHNLILSL